MRQIINFKEVKPIGEALTLHDGGIGDPQRTTVLRVRNWMVKAIKSRKRTETEAT